MPRSVNQSRGFDVCTPPSAGERALITGLRTMATAAVRLRRSFNAIHRRSREWKMIAKALVSTRHPVLAHIIPMRRCNLSCAYCNEYDAASKPVPLETIFQRIDKLASLGTTIITISGGEPLLHPGTGRHHPPHPAARHDRRADHQRLPADRRPHRAAEPRRARAPADLDRQRHARRGFEEEPQGAGQEAATAGRARRVSRQHQFGGRRRDSPSAGRAGNRAARAAAGIHLDHRHHSQRRRPAAAAERDGARRSITR